MTLQFEHTAALMLEFELRPSTAAPLNKDVDFTALGCDLLIGGIDWADPVGPSAQSPV